MIKDIKITMEIEIELNFFRDLSPWTFVFIKERNLFVYFMDNVSFIYCNELFIYF